jgi:hypothetical protein
MTNPVTPETIAAALTAAGFAEYRDGQFGFTVTRAAFGGEIIVDLKGVDLLPFNPGEGPRALLGDYRAALEAAGYQVRSTAGLVCVDPGADTGQPDIIPDLARLILAGLAGRHDTFGYAARVAAALQIAEDDPEASAEARLRKALGLAGGAGAVCKCVISGGDLLPIACPAHGTPCKDCGGLEDCEPGCGAAPADGEDCGCGLGADRCRAAEDGDLGD